MGEHTNGGYVRYGARDGGAGELAIAAASYGSGGLGAWVGYEIVDSPFGRILVAATTRGLTWLGVHESDAFLESELRADYPRAELRAGNGDVQTLGRKILDYVLGDSTELELPLDIRATPFQSAVWSELCRIPRGATRSYGEIARRIGRPDASRAVGHANGSNPIAIVIPCHRAIGTNGSLTGYRWGIAYKRRLLEHECALTQRELALDNRGPLPFP